MPARDSRRRHHPALVPPPEGKHQMPASAEPPNLLEQATLGELDKDKLSQLAECLFTLNNRRFGPIPGAYVVVCVEPDKQWCIGQLSADRARPLVLFADRLFASPEAAQREAERLRLERGETTPMRSI